MYVVRHLNFFSMLLKGFIITLFCLCILNYSINAQARKVHLEVGGSLNFGVSEGVPLGGLGSQVKALWKYKENDFWVASFGIDVLNEELVYDAYRYTFAFPSFGYRKSINSIFIEPKVGLGLCHQDNYINLSGFVGVEPGIQRRKFSFSLDYRFINADGWIEGEYFHTLAFRAGYRIF